MDAFKEAYKFTIKYEGGYVNDPSDYGGETIYGVSRVYWPRWPGWAIVDRAKRESNFPKSLYNNDELHDMVAAFYKEQFWDKLNCDELAKGSVEVAAEAFDAGVNMGIGRAAKFVQTALNIFNRNTKNYRDIAVDGDIGPTTIRTYKTFLQNNDPLLILKSQLLQRGAFYIRRVSTNATQERFIRGWLNRLVIDKIHDLD